MGDSAMATPTTSPNTGGNILGSAYMQYGQGTGSKPDVPAANVKNPAAQYEYGQAGRTGRDTDGDGFREVDCSALVYNAMRNAGYAMPGVVPTSGSVNFTTNTLFSGRTLTETATKNFDSLNPQEPTTFKTGDIMLFAPKGGAQHMGIYYGQDAQGNPMFYGSQTSTGPAVFTMKESNGTATEGDVKTFFNTDNLIGVLRPKPELYVPEMDLTGGAGTGLSSGHVMAAVNLLKSSSVEGYRPHIYSDNEQGRGDGVPTVGNGFALVVKGTNGWTIRPENDIKDLLRDAGLPESRYSELPMEKLQQSANLLNKGDMLGARAVFGTGQSDTGFGLSEAEADKLTGSFVIREVIPRTLKAVGGAENFSEFSDGEFAAVASKIYQSPSWLSSSTGKNFLQAWSRGDDEAAQALLGSGQRGQAEAQAYAGHIDSVNPNLAAAVSDTPTPASSIGHWEDSTQYDALGNVTIPGEHYWVSDEPAASIANRPATAANRSTEASLAQRAEPATAQAPEASAAKTSAAALPIGDAMEAVLPDGTSVVSISQTVNGQTTVAAELRSADGHVLLRADPGQTMERDPETGIVQVRAGTSDLVQQYDPATGEVSNTLRTGSEAKNIYESLLDAFSTPRTAVGPGIQVADASGELPATSGNSAPTLDTYLSAEGSKLSPAQQKTLSTQIDRLGLGGEDALSFYALPNGGAIIANSDGDIVGEIVRSSSGDLNIKATAIAADGTVVEVNQHISEQGTIQDQAQYNAATQQQAAAMFNSLMAAGHWDDLSDLGKFSTLVNLYNATDKLGEAFGATGDNLPGDLGAAAGWLSLAQGLQSGDNLVIANGINIISDHALDNALGEAFGSSSAGQAVPYLSYALALRNFADNPEQALFTAAGTYLGEGLGAALGGPIGAAIGGAIGGMIGGMVGGLFGDDDPPPPPEGAVHFSWDVNGHIQHTIDYNQSGGGDAADSVAASVQSMLQSLVDAQNAKSASTADDIAINPYLLPKFGFSGNSAWMEVVLPDGSTVREGMDHEGFAQRLLEVLQDNGGLAPAWQVQTQHLHYQHALQEGQTQEQAEAPLRLGAGGQAYAGDDAFSLQGNAAESADFKSQTFGALVVHLNDNPTVQAAQTQMSQVLRDVEGDGYFESTQAVAATDSAGNLQAVLTLDFNGNGLIETRDILNLGGNVGADGNPTTEAALAKQNADLQRNNVAWIDANGDGQLTAQDPAFAAIRLWVDINQDGVQVGNEASSLSVMYISSINFKTGLVTYEDGHTDALTAQTLKADTEGVKFTAINEVNPDGTLHTLDAGTVLEHEGYLGKVQITDEGGTRWASERDHTYEQQAMRTGDWEGTAEQEAHRHGGGNTQGAPTETTATGATNLGPVKTAANVTTQSLVTLGDDRVVSDVPAQAPTQPSTQPTAKTTVDVGDGRIKSNATAPNNSAAATPRPPDTRIVFVPTSQTSLQSEIQAVTNSMIESSQNLLSGASANAGLGLLAAIGMGVAQNAQGTTEQHPTLVSDVVSSSVRTSPDLVSSNNTFNTTPNSNSAGKNTSSVTFKQVDLGVFNVPQLVQTTPTSTSSTGTGTAPIANLPKTEVANTTFVEAMVMVVPPVLIAQNKAPAVVSSDALAPASALETPASNAQAPSLGYPVVQAETLPGAEDLVPRLTQSVLLANDSTPNASADPRLAALTITAVSAPTHGQVSLVNGEVLFAPDVDFHGTASFVYTVTDQYGLSSTATATLQITAVNDAPLTQGEMFSGHEDIELVFTQGQLLSNDKDVDTVTDGQVLGINRVGLAEHGVVRLDAQGSVYFTPDANYHGPAQFTYWVSDGTANNGAGAEVPAAVNLTIAAVNDAPVLGQDTESATEDTTLTIAATTLLANDTDVDIATDGQVLGISSASAITDHTHGSVSLLTQPDGTQQVQFTPDANFHGTAKFSYTVSDGNGGFSTSIATVNMAAVNDAPVTQGELASTDEDIKIVFTQAQLLTNDSDVDVATDAQVLRISAVSGAQNGTVSLQANGDIWFVPDANYHGPAEFTYTVNDGNDGHTEAKVNLIVTAVNDTPVANFDVLAGTEDTVLTIAATTLLANDTDVDVATDGQVLRISSINAITDQTHGSVSLVTQSNGTQQVQFTPDANFHGTAKFSYTVSDGHGGVAREIATVNMAAINDVPVAAGETAQTSEDNAIVFTQSELLANDTDVDVATDGQVLRISRVSDATHGQVMLHSNGDIRFVPDANFHGPAQFTYWISDGSVQEGAGAEVAATVRLTVTSINDTPVAVGDVFSTVEDATTVWTAQQLLGNDWDNDIATDGDALTISRVFSPHHCTATLNTDGTISFTPDANYHGNVRFSYEITDKQGASSIAFVVAGVNAVNDAPVSSADSFSSLEDHIVRLDQVDLLSNDTDSDISTDGDVIHVASVGHAQNGQVRMLETGQIEFLPDLNFHGTASFDYVVSDSFGSTSTNTVTLSVGAINDAPLVGNERSSVSEDVTYTTMTSVLLANDTDVDMATDGQTLSISQVLNAQHGVVYMDTNEVITFIPDANFHGTASFDYAVSDSAGGLTTGKVTFNVQSVNDAPVTQGELASTDEDTRIVFTQAQLLANDSDVDVDTDAQVLSISAVSGAQNGAVSLQANGDIWFVPDANYHGPAEFTYTVNDGNDGHTEAKVNLTVSAVNDAPVANVETFEGFEDTQLLIAATTLLANDTDADIATDGQVLGISSASAITDHTHGSVSLLTQPDGTQQVQFTPDANFHGTAKFSYTVSDGNGGFSTSIATVNMAAVNDAPVTQGELASTDEDIKIVFTQAQLLTNDSDVDVATDAQVLRISAVSGAQNGTVSLQANGDIWFVPDANYHGPAEFTYTVNDGNDGHTEAKVNLIVTAVNDTPVANFDVLAGTEDTVLTIAATTLLANDTDADMATDGQVLSISSVSTITDQTHGSVSLLTQPDGTQQVQFTPDANFHGTAKFSYTVSDGHGGVAREIATVNMAALNDAPVTQGELATTDEGTKIVFTQAQLLENDSDVDVVTDGQVLGVSAVFGAQNGIVTLQTNGDIWFVPDMHYHGPAEFTYTVSDGHGGNTDTKASLTITAVNDAPVAGGDTLNATEDTPLLIAASTFLANDSDVDTVTDGQVLTILSVNAMSDQTHGSVNLVTQSDGTQQVQFTPDLNYHGVATFNYNVSDGHGGVATAMATVNIAAVNDAPVTQGESYASDEDIGLIFTQAQLLRNDSDVDVTTDEQVLSISRVGQAGHGTVWLDAQGNLRFVPDINYHGAAQFLYWVSDGVGAETPATMRLTIAAVNDIPVVQGESTNTSEDTTLSIDAATLLANDSDVDAATDGQVLTISAVNNASHCAVSLNTQSDGSQRITFVPDANFHGTATFDYTVSDVHGGTSVATAVVNLSAVNDAPVVAGEVATVDEDLTLVFTSRDLLANDTDVDVATEGQFLRISRVGAATHGVVTLDAQGQVHFTPDANYHGPAQFTYWVSDGPVANGAGAEVPATVSLTILAVNDLPVVTGEIINTNEDTTLLFNPVSLLANDRDVDVATDNQTLSITAVNNATHGTVAFVTQSDGSQGIAFTPEANYSGMASYQYTVSDGAGGTAITTVVVNLAQVNDAPVAANDSLSSTAEDTALHISFASLLGNDTDEDSHNSQWGGSDDVLTVSAVRNATHGTVVIVNGEVVFTPEANYNGPASFAYQVSDSSGALSQALATFSITAVNDLPVATGETISENEDTTLVISQTALLQNDSDVDTATDGQILSITEVTNAQYGSVTLNANGTISFVPEADFNGNASFDYTVIDGNGGVMMTTATIALANVNDAPVATGETIAGVEDQTLTIVAGALLQNDSDVDNVHGDLVISRVQSGMGGTVNLNASGNVVFAPTANYNGNATFTYWVKDPAGLESNAVTTTVVLAALNDAPSAQGEVLIGASEDAAFNINKATLLANDHDIDDPNSALSLSWVGNATGGVVSLDDSGNVVFTPALNFNGNATFQYTVRDAAALESAIVQALIPLAAVNDAPVAVDDQFTTYNNSTLTIALNQLTSNDTDVENDALTVSAVRDHANGHASIVNGQVQFVASAGFTGAASFDYLADDGQGGQTWATAFVDVRQPPNQYPMIEIRQETAHSAVSWSNGSVSYSAGYYLEKLILEFNPSDDGLGPIDIKLISANKYSFYGFNASMVSASWWGWYGGANGVTLDMTNKLMTFSTTDSYEKGFNQYQTVWKITDENGVSNIWHYDLVSYSGYQLTSIAYNEHSGYFIPPIIFDLKGDGVQFTSIQDSHVAMDVNHDGIKDKMAWAGNDDGVLVWDKDHNHQITDASEFGFQTLKPGAQTDLEGLQALDANGNGLLDSGDTTFAEFAVWQDANGNGITDAGEFKTLTEMGIASIHLKSNGQVRDAGALLVNSSSGETDATVMGNAVFTRTDGSTGTVADTMLAYEAGHATTPVTAIYATDVNTAEIMRQALLFNQTCNTAIRMDSTPLGFVPIEPDSQLHDMLVPIESSSQQLMQPA
jgi:hypothetical protein